MNNYSEEFNWGSFLCRITGIGTSDPKTKILIILCIVNIEGHRDRYIGSLFRVDGPVPMIRTMSNAVVKMLDSLGVEPESIMYDNFG